MSSSIKAFEHLRFSLKEIKLATDDFANRIGQGGFGTVYTGKLVLSSVLTLVAVKRLNNSLGQGAPEFWREIMLLSSFKHENLISLLGFCDEGGESILVYEYLPNKSLDLHLSSTDLSWTQRLSICIGAARGLQHLHEPPKGSQQRVLHRDIKSANILLNQNWEAKIADFGLSKFGPANQQYTFLYSNAVGTMGYCDPLYMRTGLLTKESDIYSFGVVLFEVLCGRPCVKVIYEDNRRFLPELARKCYQEKTVDSIVYSSLKEQISPECLQRFTQIAYQCLLIDHTQRPLVTNIVKELEIALQYQMEYDFENASVGIGSDHNKYWETKLPQDWEIIAKMFNISPAIYTNRKNMVSHLQKGLLFDENKAFFWINDYGKKCELISATRFVKSDTEWVLYHDSRFPKVAEYSFLDHGFGLKIKCQIQARMLSLDTMYAASLVFKVSNKPTDVDIQSRLMRINWNMEELSVDSTHLAEPTTSHSDWYKLKMWNFINHGPNTDFDFVVTKLSHYDDRTMWELFIQGIEFQPIEMMKHEDIQEFRSLSISDKDDEYEKKDLRYEYGSYIEMSDMTLNYTTNKELYLCLCNGFLADESQLWFSLCKPSGGISAMLRATDALRHSLHSGVTIKNKSLSESRFGEVLYLSLAEHCNFRYSLSSHMFSYEYSYGCYLVFKFANNRTMPDETFLFRTEYKLDDTSEVPMFACLNLPLVNIPTIKPKNEELGFHDSSNISRTEEVGLPNGQMELQINSKITKRTDGWMEVMLCKPLPHLQNHSLLDVALYGIKSFILWGMMIEGIEFRPYIY